VAGWILLVVVLVLLFLGILGIRRDRQNTGRGTASRVMRAGFLEMQELLEPEKKVEILKQEKRDDLLIVVDPSGAPPVPRETKES
jgi:hypothetical protein